jgi:hypothetical protein
MRICGVDLGGNSAHLVFVEGDETGWRVLDCETKKMALENSTDPDEVKSFKRLFEVLVADFGVDVIAVKGRQETGRFAGSGTSFKIEGLIQLVEGSAVIVMSPNTLKAVLRRHPVTIPEGLYKYQHEAFEVAYCYLKQ